MDTYKRQIREYLQSYEVDAKSSHGKIDYDKLGITLNITTGLYEFVHIYKGLKPLYCHVVSVLSLMNMNGTFANDAIVKYAYREALRIAKIQAMTENIFGTGYYEYEDY